jgi:Arc-like DNA binding domain
MTVVDNFSKLTIRIPVDVKEWLAKRAKENAGSMGSEIVRSIRNTMTSQSNDTR